MPSRTFGTHSLRAAIATFAFFGTIASGAATVGTNLPLAGTSGLPSYQGDPAIAVDPANPQVMAVNAVSFYSDVGADNSCAPDPFDATFYSSGVLFYTTNGGASWTSQCMPWPSDADGGGANAGVTGYYSSDPSIAWSPGAVGTGGTQSAPLAVVTLWAEHDSSKPFNTGALGLARYNGTKWVAVGTVANQLASTDGQYYDRSSIAVDYSAAHYNRIYVASVHATHNATTSTQKADLFYSDTGGASGTWTEVPNIEAPNYCAQGNYCYNLAPAVAVDADGYVYLTWKRLYLTYKDGTYTETGETTVFAFSKDGAKTWSTPQEIVKHTLLSFGANGKVPAQNDRGINTTGSLMVDRNWSSKYVNRIYLSYTDFPSVEAATQTPTNTDVYIRYIDRGNLRKDGTTPISAAIRVNNDTGTATQFFPWLSVDNSDGTVNVAWYDTRNYASSGNKKTQVFYARSANGGASFEPNVQMTLASSSFTNKVDYLDLNATDYPAAKTTPQYADYLGMVAANRKAWAVWTDSRAAYPSAGGKPQIQVEAAGASVTNCSSPSAISTPVVQCGGSSGAKISWTARSSSSWGTGTGSNLGTLSVYRYPVGTSSNGSDGGCTPLYSNEAPIASALAPSTVSYTDKTATKSTSYNYVVAATNTCPGTALTPMSTYSACSAVVTCP